MSRVNAVQPILSDCAWRIACIRFGQQKAEADTRRDIKAGRLIALAGDHNLRLFGITLASSSSHPSVNGTGSWEGCAYPEALSLTTYGDSVLERSLRPQTRMFGESGRARIDAPCCPLRTTHLTQAHP